MAQPTQRNDHQPLSQEQLDRVAKIAKWMQTLNDQQVTDLLHLKPTKKED